MNTINFVGGSLLLLNSALAGSTPNSVRFPSETTLCTALESVKDGENLPVVISGVYFIGPETKIFYDPKAPLCQEDIQPSTWVEFTPSVSGDSRLEKILKKDGRAYVTFKGTLMGPKIAPPDDPSLPPYASYAKRVAGRRYGHLNGFRTELVVSAVLEAKAVPKEVPFAGEWRKPLQDRLIVQDAGLPRYPPMARGAGISGEVQIEIKVSSGKVVSAEAISGDRLLAAEALSNVKTWTFVLNKEDESFTVKFVYILERRRLGENEAPRLELNLPFLVKIISPTLDW
jgi:TonB family protein